MGNNAKYLELEQNAISNPLYCSDNDKEMPIIESQLDEDSLEHLWYPPNRNSIEMAEAELNNLNGLGKESMRLLQNGVFEPNQIGYDVPRPLIEAKTTEQKLRYENEVVPVKKSDSKNSYINESIGQNQHFFLVRGEDNNCQQNLSGYESPITQGKSYLDMTRPNSDETRSQSNGVYYKTVNKHNKNISDNLDTKNINKKLSKDLSLKFMSLLNLSEESTSVM